MNSPAGRDTGTEPLAGSRRALAKDSLDRLPRQSQNGAPAGALQNALHYANSVLELLERSNIPPEPPLYHLFYDYIAGVEAPEADPATRQLWHEAVTTRGPVSANLYQQFLGSYRHAEAAVRFTGVTDRLKVLHQLIDDSCVATRAHSMALSEAASQLSDDRLRRGLLEDLIYRLEITNRRMIKANAALTAEVEAARAELTGTRQNLSRLEQAARIDELTGLANRQGVDEALALEVVAARKSGRPLTVGVVDIDHFKNFNDTFGHQAGDAVLRVFAAAFRATVREQATLGRLGGDEFVAILPNTDAGGAEAFAERLRQTLVETDLGKHIGERVAGGITTSIGIAASQSDDNGPSLLARADACLIKAKQTGRNRIVVDSHRPTVGVARS